MLIWPILDGALKNLFRKFDNFLPLLKKYILLQYFLVKQYLMHKINLDCLKVQM